MLMFMFVFTFPVASNPVVLLTISLKYLVRSSRTSTLYHKTSITNLIVGIIGVLGVLLLDQPGEGFVHKRHEPQVLQLDGLSELLVVLHRRAGDISKLAVKLKLSKDAAGTPAALKREAAS